MKSRFIRAVSAPNSWEDHHHLILSLRPVMGIQRAGYQTVQSAGKTCTHTHARKHTWEEKEREREKKHGFGTSGAAGATADGEL